MGCGSNELLLPGRISTRWLTLDSELCRFLACGLVQAVVTVVSWRYAKGCRTHPSGHFANQHPPAPGRARERTHEGEVPSRPEVADSSVQQLRIPLRQVCGAQSAGRGAWLRPWTCRPRADSCASRQLRCRGRQVLRGECAAGGRRSNAASCGREGEYRSGQVCLGVHRGETVVGICGANMQST